MILKENGKEVKLVQLKNNDGTELGLYLVPKEIPIEDFEKLCHQKNTYNTYKEMTMLGIQMVHPYILNISWINFYTNILNAFTFIFQVLEWVIISILEILKGQWKL